MFLNSSLYIGNELRLLISGTLFICLSSLAWNNLCAGFAGASENECVKFASAWISFLYFFLISWYWDGKVDH